MAFLPVEPLTLTGGCFCTAIRYTISVPPLTSRPVVPGALPTPISSNHSHPHPTAVETRLPLIDLDHCNSCRRACGGLIQCWFICPQNWVQFTLETREATSAGPCSEKTPEQETYSVPVLFPSTPSVVATPPPHLTTSTYLSHFASSPGICRSFCSHCGTGIAWCNTRDRGPEWTLGEIVDIAVGTLDRESLEKVRPDRHGWWADGVGWIRELVTEGDGGLVRHPGGSVRVEVEVEREGVSG